MNYLSLLNPYGLLALGCLLIVIAAYLFYQRYKPEMISGLFLWGKSQTSIKGGRKVQKPRMNRSFIFDLLAIIFLALALAAPAILHPSKNLQVIILDNSFSMRAENNHEKARKAVLDIISDSDRSYAVLLAGSGARSVITPETSPAEFSELLTSYNPYALKADFNAATKLAQNLYGQSIDIITISDQKQLLTIPQEISHTEHILAGNKPNIAFTGIWVQNKDNTRDITLQVCNYSATAQAVSISFSSDENEITTKKLNMKAQATENISLNLDKSPRPLKIKISAREDSISEDSVAWIAPSNLKPITFFSESISGSKYYSLSFKAAGAVESTEHPDILVTKAPAQRGRLLTLLIPPDNSPLTFAAPFIVDLNSPICRDVDPASAYWTAPDSKLKSASPVLISSDRTVLLEQKTESLFTFNLDAGKSSLPSTPAWPALISNITEYAKSLRHGLHDLNLAPTSSFSYRKNGDEKLSFRKIEPKKGEIQFIDSGLELPEISGLYELYSNNQTIAAFSLLPLYAQESDTGKLSAKTINTKPGNEQNDTRKVYTNLYYLPLLIALILLAYNWRKDKDEF